MSVYSGFATRQQQTKYNNLLQNLVIALKKRIIKFYTQEPCDQDKFKLLIKKIYKKMFLLEKGKFMTPKYSTCYNDLVEALNIQINYDSLSDASSVISQTFSLKKDNSDPENQIFKSRAMLEIKKNQIQTQLKGGSMNVSTLSLDKKLHTIQFQNSARNQQQQRSTSLGISPVGKSRAKVKLRELRDLKDIRGTMHMPRVQDFLPKKQQVQPSLFRNPQKVPLIREQKGFRRQKYSRNDISVEDI